MALQIPARSVPRARGEVRGKKEEVPAHLLVVLDRWEKVGKVLDSGGQGAAAEVQRRRGSLVRDWRQGEAGELRRPKVELAVVFWVSGRGFGEEARETE